MMHPDMLKSRVEALGHIFPDVTHPQKTNRCCAHAASGYFSHVEDLHFLFGFVYTGEVYL